KMGQSIKEYSNFFDRGYWQLGTRRAQPSYDLFALVMIVLTIYYPKQFKRGKHPRQQLIKAVQSIPELRVFAHCLSRIIGSVNSFMHTRSKYNLFRNCEYLLLVCIKLLTDPIILLKQCEMT